MAISGSHYFACHRIQNVRAKLRQIFRPGSGPDTPEKKSKSASLYKGQEATLSKSSRKHAVRTLFSVLFEYQETLFWLNWEMKKALKQKDTALPLLLISL